ncbi:DNA ligase [Cohnella yongneupensis]|uniref:DNA ligase (ATP) n=1 Tax=Cohnella yongneupensis TaxID=425006 RepID=A0ABW0R6R4_9BACL
MLLQPVAPFEPIAGVRLPEGDRWIAQLKWDGVRMLSYYDGAMTRLVNRRLHERTARYPELADARTYCSASSAILDGEIVAFLDGKPSFQQVMRRDGTSSGRLRNLPAISYMVFDVLHLNGQSVMHEPLAERQRLLERHLEPNDSVQLVTNFPDIPGLLAVTREHRLEGIVAKDLESGYAVGGKDKRWQKFKHYRDLIAVVGGVTFRGNIVNSLLLGLYDEAGRLHYIGNAGTGKWTQQDWRDFTERTNEIGTPKCPFSAAPSRSLDIKWIQPQLTVKVAYLEWTTHRTLRQPVIQALTAMEPGACTFGQA